MDAPDCAIRFPLSERVAISKTLLLWTVSVVDEELESAESVSVITVEETVALLVNETDVDATLVKEHPVKEQEVVPKKESVVPEDSSSVTPVRDSDPADSKLQLLVKFIEESVIVIELLPPKATSDSELNTQLSIVKESGGNVEKSTSALLVEGESRTKFVRLIEEVLVGEAALSRLDFSAYRFCPISLVVLFCTKMTVSLLETTSK
tara:strand:- start:718 stop:1338 length:621 start_codon:yes stop_codon:yes gene_type:complete